MQDSISQQFVAAYAEFLTLYWADRNRGTMSSEAVTAVVKQAGLELGEGQTVTIVSWSGADSTDLIRGAFELWVQDAEAPTRRLLVPLSPDVPQAELDLDDLKEITGGLTGPGLVSLSFIT